jgi:hypothetical protein
MLDAYLKFGTREERTDKQPGIPGTQQPHRPLQLNPPLAAPIEGHEKR